MLLALERLGVPGRVLKSGGLLESSVHFEAIRVAISILPWGRSS